MNDFDFEREHRYYSKDLGLYPDEVASRMGMSRDEYEARLDTAIKRVNRYWDDVDAYNEYLDRRDGINTRNKYDDVKKIMGW